MDNSNIDIENVERYFELWKNLQKCSDDSQFNDIRSKMRVIYSTLLKSEKDYFKEISNNFEKFGTTNPNISKRKKKKKR